jgi:hypothetical protein
MTQYVEAYMRYYNHERLNAANDNMLFISYEISQKRVQLTLTRAVESI